MLKIHILYDSKYSLSTTKNGESFLTGMAVLKDVKNINVKNIFKEENSFLQNVKELNKYYPNYQYADITQNTVMGILCRLAGEVRRLSDLDNNHPILKLKDKVTFENLNSSFQSETIQLHTEIKEVQNNAGGLISVEKSNHFLLTKNELSETLMSVFSLNSKEDIYDLLDSMKQKADKYITQKYKGEISAVTLIKEMGIKEEMFKDLIPGFFFEDVDGRYEEINGHLYFALPEKIENLKKFINENQNIKPGDITKYRKEIEVDEIFNIWGVLFAKKIRYLLERKVFEKEFANSLNTKKTSIKGLAPNSGSLTVKDYYSGFVDEKKKSWTMPYAVDLKKDLFEPGSKDFNFGAKVGVIKECGELIISLNIDNEEINELITRFENAGVATFQLGKKGLAYVDKITLE